MRKLTLMAGAALVLASTSAFAFGYDPKWPASTALTQVLNAYETTGYAAKHPLMLVPQRDLAGYVSGAAKYGLNLYVFELSDDAQWSLVGYGPTVAQGQTTIVAFGAGGNGGRPGDGGHSGFGTGYGNGGVAGTGLDVSHMVTDIGLAISSDGAYTHAPADEANPFGNATPAGLNGNGGNYSADSNGGTAVGGNDECGCNSGEPF